MVIRREGISGDSSPIRGCAAMAGLQGDLASFLSRFPCPEREIMFS
jgi:hypothetical protein